MANSFDEEPDFDIAYDPSDEVERTVEFDDDDDWDDGDYAVYDAFSGGADEDEYEDNWDDENDWDDEEDFDFL